MKAFTDEYPFGAYFTKTDMSGAGLWKISFDKN